VTVVGIGITLMGGALAVGSGLLLLGRGRPHRGPTPSFVVAGPYLRVRNPLYAGLLLMALGAALASASWVVAALALAGALAAHLWILWVEEPHLRQRFGPAYVAYLERVPRWVPRTSRVGD